MKRVRGCKATSSNKRRKKKEKTVQACAYSLSPVQESPVQEDVVPQEPQVDKEKDRINMINYLSATCLYQVVAFLPLPFDYIEFEYLKQLELEIVKERKSPKGSEGKRLQSQEPSSRKV